MIRPIIIHNDQLVMEVSPIGASLISLVDKYLSKDILVSVKRQHDIATNDKYFGATVGRCANRIAFGKFTLDGKPIQLEVNNGIHHLHGGSNGLHRKVFDVKEVTRDSVTLTTEVFEKDDGYPGNAKIQVKYRLHSNQCIIELSASSNQKSIMNLTNHAYFNANFSGNIEDQQVYVNGSSFYEVDETGCTTAKQIDVTDTPFDLRTPIRLIDVLGKNHPQLSLALGIDHHFPIDGEGLRKAATLLGDAVEINVYTDAPGIHVYTGNYLDGCDHNGYGKVISKRDGICFEAQSLPNAVNIDPASAPWIDIENPFSRTIIYECNGRKR